MALTSITATTGATVDGRLLARNGALVLVTQGYHPVAAAPGSNVYFLNFLAGELLDEARARPPLDDHHFAWMKQNWEGNRLVLPIPGTLL